MNENHDRAYRQVFGEICVFAAWCKLNEDPLVPWKIRLQQIALQDTMRIMSPLALITLLIEVFQQFE